MRKIVLGLAASVALSGVVFAADYSKISQKELINLAGSIEPKDVASYEAEINKRADEMTMKEAREFRTQTREQEKKVYDNMKVKDFKARQKAIREARMQQCKNDPKSCPHKMGAHKGMHKMKHDDYCGGCSIDRFCHKGMHKMKHDDCSAGGKCESMEHKPRK